MSNQEERDRRVRLNGILDKLILAGIVALITASIGSSIALAKLNTKFDLLSVTISNIPGMQEKQAHLEERQIELYRRQDMDDIIHEQLSKELREKTNANK